VADNNIPSRRTFIGGFTSTEVVVVEEENPDKGSHHHSVYPYGVVDPWQPRYDFGDVVLPETIDTEVKSPEGVTFKDAAVSETRCEPCPIPKLEDITIVVGEEEVLEAEALLHESDHDTTRHAHVTVTHKIRKHEPEPLAVVLVEAMAEWAFPTPALSVQSAEIARLEKDFNASNLWDMTLTELRILGMVSLTDSHQRKWFDEQWKSVLDKSDAIALIEVIRERATGR